MRARNIKPGFFKNEDLAECPFEARILFSGLWCLADRAGRMEYRPKRIKAEIFPFDSVDIPSMVQALCKYGFARIYVVDGVTYLDLPTFCRNQTPHKNEKPSVLPPFEERDDAPDNRAKHDETTDSGASTVPARYEHGTGTSAIHLITDSLKPDILKPDSQISDAAGAADDSPPPDDGFDRFWQAYPVKKDKGHARKVWQKIRPSPELTERMLEAIAVQIMEHDARQTATGSAPYWKHPATWLNGECWNDEPMTPDQIQSLTKRNGRPSTFVDSNPEHTAALERAFG